MPIPMQIKLLRVLQERTLERLGSNTAIPIDCRIVAATKEDLRVLSDQGRFRADLYYRLSVATVPLPPLRDRLEDIPLLFQHFLLQASARHGRPVPTSDSVRTRQLVGYHWPGNVRELSNVADRCVLGIEYGAPPFGDEINNRPLPLSETVEAFERALIADALHLHHGSLTRSAEALGIAKTTLHDKIRKYGLTETGSA
jgi:DNA-binding NtrC family response regulator